MIRVLIADDSPTVRALLRAVLEADPELEVVGEACDGEEAVEMVRTLRPDIVTMDMLMPRVDGLDATRRIMSEQPTPIVVVSASNQESAISRSFDALEAGAVTVLDKPVDPADPHFEARTRRIVSTVKDLAGIKVVRRWKHPRGSRNGGPPGDARVVGIAASTGGPAALGRVLGGLASPLPVPVLVVQHIAAGFGHGMVAWLAGRCTVPLTVARDGQRLEPGTVYFAPDGAHLGLGRGSRVELSPGAAADRHCPSATRMFSSVATMCGPGAIAVVLTGMGRDGLEGIRELKAAGGTVVVQDEATSVVYGMNGEVARAGLADWELPIGEIATRLTRLVGAAT